MKPQRAPEPRLNSTPRCFRAIVQQRQGDRLPISLRRKRGVVFLLMLQDRRTRAPTGYGRNMSPLRGRSNAP